MYTGIASTSSTDHQHYIIKRHSIKILQQRFPSIIFTRDHTIELKYLVRTGPIVALITAPERELITQPNNRNGYHCLDHHCPCISIWIVFQQSQFLQRQRISKFTTVHIPVHPFVLPFCLSFRITTPATTHSTRIFPNTTSNQYSIYYLNCARPERSSQDRKSVV